jgi:hypothetical protein
VKTSNLTGGRVFIQFLEISSLVCKILVWCVMCKGKPRFIFFWGGVMKKQPWYWKTVYAGAHIN